MSTSASSKRRHREQFLPFAMPDVGQEELEAIRQVMESGWLTTGPKAHEFEKRFAARVGARHAVAVNSCTAALHLALEAIGLKAGDEVVTTPYTFTATAEVVVYFGARPVFVDVEPRSLNMDPDALGGAITPRTRAVIPIHMAGLAADLDAILEVARRHEIAVVEDAAHAFPSSCRGRTIGSVGDITCFSFYATKTITTGEGGMICTDNATWAERCRRMSLHGISNDSWKRYGESGSWYYEVAAPGFKYNMTDVAAAMGLVQLEKADVMRGRRMGIARRYSEAFGGSMFFEVPEERPDCEHAWHLYQLRLHLGQLRIDRARFVDELRGRNIGTSVHFIPLHLHPYYRDTYGHRPSDFPISVAEYEREISLPIYSRMTDEDVADVIEAVLEVGTENAR
jgi:dTDP-4-amino-4,6-dideoxygalactose transaminase